MDVTDAFYNQNPEVRASVVQANRPDTDKHHLGNYGSPGAEIFGQSTTPGGRINSFTGSGQGGKVPDTGVRFASPSASFGSSGYPQSPGIVTSPAAQRAQANIAQVAEQLAKTQPGKFDGKKGLMRKLDGLTGAAQALQRPADIENAFNQAAHGHQVAQFGHSATLAGQVGANNLAEAQSARDYALKQQAADTERKKLAHTYGTERLKQQGDMIKAAAASAGDPALAAHMETLLYSMKLKGKDGKRINLHDVPQAEFGDLLNRLIPQAKAMSRVVPNGKLPSNTGNNTFGEAGFGDRAAETFKRITRYHKGNPLESANPFQPQLTINDGDAMIPANEIGSLEALKNSRK